MVLSEVRQGNLYVCVKDISRKGHCIAQICNILELNRSSYYKWTHRVKSNREQENELLLIKIGKIYAQYNGILGYRGIADRYHEEEKPLKRYNDKRFYRLTQLVGLKAVIRRKRTIYPKATPEITAENLLNREFTAETPNQKWLTDITEMKFNHGSEKLYLSAILDLKGRDIVSFVISRHNNTKLVNDTFQAAVAKHPTAHPLFHSDRGFQYTRKQFREMLDKHKMTQSMSRVGRCIDNGPMEGFWGILKCEMYYLSRFSDYYSLVKAITGFIYYYNYERLQRNLLKMAPMKYRSLFEKTA